VGTRIITLGTGAGPTVRKFRSQPANLLVVEGRPYLIDVGEGAIRQLVQAGFQPSDVEQVFLTHMHFDHTADLASFMAFDWTNRRVRPVGIYGPPGTVSMTRAGLAYFGNPVEVFSKQLPPTRPIGEIFEPHDLDVTKPVVVFQDDKVRVLAVETSHFATLRDTKMSFGEAKPYAYRFETKDRVVVFTGDTGPSAALEDLARGADVLVSEVIDIDQTISLIRKTWKGSPEALKPLEAHMRQEHLAPEEVGKMATRAGVKMVVLTHLAPALDEDIDASRFTDGVRRYYAGPVIAAHDLSEF
jgi:ribonuclease BN (tRNA processing enzyme)